MRTDTARVRAHPPNRRRVTAAVLFGAALAAAFTFGAHPARASAVNLAQSAIAPSDTSTLGTGGAAAGPTDTATTHTVLFASSSGTSTSAASAPSSTTSTVRTGIQVGPTGTTTQTVPTPGSGGSVDGGSSSSPGLFDITGHITAALDSWFSGLVTSALDPILTVLGHTLLATPDVTGQQRVGELWGMTQGIADACLVLFIVAGGAIVMGHETIQTKTALKDVAPRIVVAAIAANASLGVAGLAISTADSLSQAVLGQGVDPAQATVVLRQLILGALTGGGIFVVLLGGVVAVLAVVVLATFVIRLALVVLLVVSAPMALVCHALPQTEGLARLWWRAFVGTLAVQVAQSLVLVTALRVFFASGGPASLGIASTGGMVDLLVAACLCWVLVKIPSWVGRMVFSGGGRRHSGGATRVVRDVVVYKAAKAVAAAVAL